MVGVGVGACLGVLAGGVCGGMLPKSLGGGLLVLAVSWVRREREQGDGWDGDGGLVEIAGTSLHLRRDRFGLVTMVPQEAYVFAGSLRDNLTYLRPPASDEEVAASAQAVGLERVLDRLGGFDAQIDLAKSGLSAGEKQLVTLVRAHLAATPIVVLDEATCHLDPAAEEKAERAFMATGSTLIVVAHRMSATLRAKRVMVMDGDGIDVGDHRQLMQRHALYADFHVMWSVPTTEQRA